MGKFGFDSVRKRCRQLKSGVYADWTGAALPTADLISIHNRTLQTVAYGNPHSHHRPSSTAMDQIMETRKGILN